MLKNTTFLVFLGLLLCACSIGRLTKKNVYTELPGEQYFNMIQDSNVQIIDVRTKGEYEKSHISGAVNFSYLGGGFKKAVAESDLDPTKTTLIYCETQHRSLFAAKKLYRIGYKNIIDLDKGMMRWRKDGLPYISDTLSND
ncbi:MAG: rhodanese-like domain-containing protein [Crocinitomicaceae bacterium]